MVGKKLQRAIERHRAAYRTFFFAIDALPDEECEALSDIEDKAARKITNMKFANTEEFLHALRHIAARGLRTDIEEDLKILVCNYFGLTPTSAAEILGVADIAPDVGQITA